MSATRPARSRFRRRRPAPAPAWRRLLDVLLAVAILALVGLIALRYDRLATREIGGAPVVNDGDTLTLGGERIRLRGLDAPELDQVCRRRGADYGCGRKARQAVRDTVAGRPVACRGWERDRYGRLLAVCFVGNADLNALIVRSGWAVSDGRYSAEEREARDAGRGIWAGPFERPRAWRMRVGSADESGGAIERMANWVRQLLGWRDGEVPEEPR